jgi:hypothetical protein
LGSLVGERAHRDLYKNSFESKTEFRYLLFGAFHVKRYSREKPFRMCTIGFITIHVSHVAVDIIAFICREGLEGLYFLTFYELMSRSQQSVIATLNYLFDLLIEWTKIAEIIKLRKIIQSTSKNHIIPAKISKKGWTGLRLK